MKISSRIFTLDTAKLASDGGHAFARLRAAAALRGTLLHDPVVPCHPLAIVRARAADLSAKPASELMPVGAAKHEVRRRLADVSAVEQEPDVGGFGMAPAHLETMGDGLQTDAVTSQACFDALLHLTADGGSGGMLLMGHF